MTRAVRTHPAAGVSVSWFSTHTKSPAKKTTTEKPQKGGGMGNDGPMKSDRLDRDGISALTQLFYSLWYISKRYIPWFYGPEGSSKILKVGVKEDTK